MAYSKDPLAKIKRNELRSNVTDSYLFNMCYEKALAMVEKKELEFEFEKDDQTRDGRIIGKLIHKIFHGGRDKNINLDFDIEQGAETRKVVRVRDYDDRGGGRRRSGPGCWMRRRWDDDRRWDDSRRRWGDTRQWDDDWGRYDRDGDECSCDDNLCCDCEPDRGGSCCKDWCEDMCDQADWDFNIVRFCNRPVHQCDALCMKFEHCCNNRCRQRY